MKPSEVETVQEWDGSFHSLSSKSKVTFTRNMIVNLIMRDGHKDDKQLDEVSEDIVKLVDEAITNAKQEIRDKLLTIINHPKYFMQEQIKMNDLRDLIIELSPKQTEEVQGENNK